MMLQRPLVRQSEYVIVEVIGTRCEIFLLHKSALSLNVSLHFQCPEKWPQALRFRQTGTRIRTLTHSTCKYTFLGICLQHIRAFLLHICIFSEQYAAYRLTAWLIRTKPLSKLESPKTRPNESSHRVVGCHFNP